MTSRTQPKSIIPGCPGTPPTSCCRYAVEPSACVTGVLPADSQKRPVVELLPPFPEEPEIYTPVEGSTAAAQRSACGVAIVGGPNMRSDAYVDVSTRPSDHTTATVLKS